MASDGVISLFGLEIGAAGAFAALGAAVLILLLAFWFAFKAIEAAAGARVARAEAAAKFSAAQQLSEEVSRLRAQVEEAVLHHNSAVTNAFLMHNDACAATRTSPRNGFHAEARPAGSFLSDAEHHAHHAAPPRRTPAHDERGHREETAPAARTAFLPTAGGRGRTEAPRASRGADERPAPSFLQSLFSRTNRRDAGRMR